MDELELLIGIPEELNNRNMAPKRCGINNVNGIAGRAFAFEFKY